MKVFFDFEFIETGAAHVMEPISLGAVREDGNTYYAEFSNIPWNLANQWVIDNVKPHLSGNSKSKSLIAAEFMDFARTSPEFWGYFSSYDWVILCQLYGRMIDLPETWPMHCLDLKQYMHHLGVKREELDFIPNEQEHNALGDAIWNRSVYSFLQEKEKK